jgi:hypothetical protein
MTEVLVSILAIPLYLSGLLLWPAFAFAWRRKNRRTKLLRIIFLTDVASLVLVAILAGFKIVVLEHFYYWFAVAILLNIFFTVIGLVAAAYDYSASVGEQ